jgi:alkylation response protein AidB-like acyl-CoA dehydrogenase
MKLLQEASAAAIQRVLSLNEFGHSRQINAVFASAIQHAVWVIERAIHLQGGMGFTWDVPLHDSLREVRKIEAAFNIANLTADIGREWIEVNA